MLSRRAVLTRTKTGPSQAHPVTETSAETTVKKSLFAVRKSTHGGLRKSKRDSSGSDELFSSGSELDTDTDVQKSKVKCEPNRESSSSPSLLNCSVPEDYASISPKKISSLLTRSQKTTEIFENPDTDIGDKKLFCDKNKDNSVSKINILQPKTSPPLSPVLGGSRDKKISELIDYPTNDSNEQVGVTKSKNATEFTKDDLETLINLPGSLATFVEDQFDKSVPILSDSSDSSVPNQTPRKRIISQKTRRKFVLESESDDSPLPSTPKSKSKHLMSRNTIGNRKNDQWVEGIQKSLERGATVHEIAPHMLLSTLKMFRECEDSDKLSKNLQISSQKYNTLLEFWEMAANSIQANKKCSSPEPTTQSSSSSSRSVYPTPAFKSKLAATPAVKSNFALDLEDFDMQDSPHDYPSCDDDAQDDRTKVPSASNGVTPMTRNKISFDSLLSRKNNTVQLNEFENLDLTKVKTEQPFDVEIPGVKKRTEMLESPMNYSYHQATVSPDLSNSKYTASSSSYPVNSASSAKIKSKAHPMIKSNFNLEIDMSEFQENPNETVNLASDSSVNSTPNVSKSIKPFGSIGTAYQSSSKTYTNSNNHPSSFANECGSPYFPNNNKSSSFSYENYYDNFDHSKDLDQLDYGESQSFGYTKSPSKTPTKTPSKLKSLSNAIKTISTDPSIGDFAGNVTNDGITGEFDGQGFPHCKMMMQVFRSKFGLRNFRLNQLQVVNAAMLDKDCFVLMPTGGGKSLCYQLTALLCPGVTIVVSPLKALILDQVQRLLSLDIAAASLSGDISLSEQNGIYSKLSSNPPGLKLLYVTPEKLSQSARIMDLLTDLYSNHLLARFVIDEAHCVSQWGHDFRPDYTKLGILKKKFPRVPCMALTATATPRVRMDILHQLGIPNSKWFLCSFNRPNLKYEVRAKKGKTKSLEDLLDVLNTPGFKGESGIVYCLSRNDCDHTAQQLKMNGVKATSYHAGLSDTKRAEAQNNWLNDRVHIVCATIAFGMGIDKPDVRFVIHYSLPKSVEGYYQESGRAGRDNDPATCILFYSAQDVIRNRRLIEMERDNFKARRVHLDNLNRMVGYCENKTDCRRAQQLEYFGQIFDAKLCKQTPKTTCDNCTQMVKYKTIDVTAECKAIVEAVKYISHGRSRDSSFTLLHFVDIFRGAEHQRIKKFNHETCKLHGRGKSWTRPDSERLLRKLVLEEYLTEELIVTRDEIAIAYVRVGPKANDLINEKVRVQFPITDKAAPAADVPINSAASIDASLEGQIGQLQQRCFRELIAECRLIAENLKCTFAAVMSVQTLRAMSVELPETPDQMLQVPGVTQANLDKYGSRLLSITVKYNAEKFLLLAEAAEKQIVDEAPSTSSSKPGGRPAGNANNYDSEPDGDGWMSASATSKYKFTPQKRGKGKATRRKSTKNFWKRKSTTKTKARTGTKRKSTSPKKSAGTGAAKKTTASCSRPNGGLGFMPAPQPAAKKMKF